MSDRPDPLPPARADALAAARALLAGIPAGCFHAPATAGT